MTSTNIYVAIASYRDPHLQSTIDSLFSSADNPETIEVGCFIQAKAADPSYSKQVIAYDYEGAVNAEVVEPGSVFSVSVCRNRSMQWISEHTDYVLQLDAHMRFDEGWDTHLLNIIESTGDSKAVLSGSLSSWFPIDELTDAYKRNGHGFTSNTFNSANAKNTFLTSHDLTPDYIHVQPNFTPATPTDFPVVMRSWYLAGAFVFGPKQFFLECPQVDWVAFWGEELLQSLRAFTNGWNAYTPWYRPLYHYFPQDTPHISKNTIWADFPNDWAKACAGVTDRLMDVVINHTIGEQYLFEKRPLDELYDLLGYRLDTLFKDWKDDYNLRYATAPSTNYPTDSDSS